MARAAEPENRIDPNGPRLTPDLIGHSTAESRLLDIWQRGRLAHAWLITGPRGVGKATLAYRFARFVLRHGVKEDSGPSLFGDAPAAPSSLHVGADDPVFRQTAQGAHPGLKVLERPWDDKKGKRKTEIPVDDVRKLVPFFGTTAAGGGWRVAVVDTADDLNRNSANALLKILEEPPQRGLLILVSHAPGRLPPTIRSRCTHLALGPLDDGSVSKILAARLPELLTADRDALVRLAEGAPGRAIELAREGGLDLYRQTAGLLAALPQVDVPGLHTFADKVARRGADEAYAAFIDLLLQWLARMVRRGAGQPLPEVVNGEGAVMDRLAAARPLDEWVDVWEKIRRLVARSDAVNLDRKQVVLSIFATLERAARADAPLTTAEQR